MFWKRKRLKDPLTLKAKENSRVYLIAVVPSNQILSSSVQLYEHMCKCGSASVHRNSTTSKNIFLGTLKCETKRKAERFQEKKFND